MFRKPVVQKATNFNSFVDNLIIFEDQDNYEIRYPIPFVRQNMGFIKSSFQQDDETKFYKDEAILKVRKADLEKKGWAIDSVEFKNYLKQGFKILVGFDFDQTLSNNHVWYDGDDMSFDNLKGGKIAQDFFSTLAQQNNLVVFMATYNTAPTAMKHLKAWEIAAHFKKILGNDEFRGSKTSAFAMMYDEVQADSALDENRFLDLDAPNKPIDIIGAVLVDDDVKHKPSMENAGLSYIPVSETRNDFAHFQKIKEFCCNHISVAGLEVVPINDAPLEENYIPAKIGYGN